MTETNVEYLVRQKEAFLSGTPGPDFPGGQGEASHVGRPSESDLRTQASLGGLRAMGLDKFVAREGDTVGARKVVDEANAVLGF